MRSGTHDGFCSIPSATGGIARLACDRLRELGKDVAAILAKVGAKPEQVRLRRWVRRTQPDTTAMTLDGRADSDPNLAAQPVHTRNHA